jgi:tRNA threonylcarbamoyladenosine biosynthesis protein TsaE
MEIIAHENELDEVVKVLIDKLPENRIFTFVGDLGAGKTTLIKKFCRELGVQGEMSSPTFGLVNTYNSHNGTIYHTDWYRVNDIVELYDVGIDESLEDGIWLIEWPEIGMDLIDFYSPIIIEISHQGLNRMYTLNMD